MTTPKPRTASGRFAAAAEVPKRSAGERHAANKVELKKLEAERDSIMVRRKQYLLNDDRRAARQCGRQLIELGLAMQEARDLDDLLLPEIRREREQQQKQREHPMSLEDAKAQLLNTEKWIVAMEARPRVDRSARFDADLDSLKNTQWRLTKLIASFEPKSMVAS